jgi:hypothetical protein
MAEKCGAQIVEGDDNGARRRPAAAPPQQDEGEKRERHEFETAKRLFPGWDVKIPFVVRQRLECRHAPRKRSRIRIAHAAESGGRFEDIAQCFLVAPDLACFCFFAAEVSSSKEGVLSNFHKEKKVGHKTIAHSCSLLRSNRFSLENVHFGRLENYLSRSYLAIAKTT